MARTVTFTIRHPDDTAWVGAVLKFRLLDDDYTSTVQYPRYTLSATATIADGTGSIELWQNALGAESTLYECILPSGETFTFEVPAGTSDIDLSTLRGGTFPSLTAGGTYSLSGYDDLADAISEIGSTQGTLLIDVSDTLAVSVTVPSTLALLWLAPNNVIDLSTYTLTVSSSIEAGLYQIFDADSGTLTINGYVKRFYPQWFGAVVDGVTDDSTAVQTTIDAAAVSGGIIYFPPGSYDLNSIVINGKGGVIYQGAGREISVLIAANFSFDTQTDIGIYDLGLTEIVTTRSLYFLDSSKIIVERCNILVTAGESGRIELRGSSDGIINDCYLDDSRRAIFFENTGSVSERWTITNNTIIHSDNTANYPAGIDMGKARHIRIAHNHIEGYVGVINGYGVYQGDNLAVESYDIVIADNIIVNCGYGVNISRAFDVVISNNTIEVVTGRGILCEGKETATASGEYQRNLTISGNVITGGQINVGEQGHNFSIVGNTIKDATTHGIYLNGDDVSTRPRYGAISGNSIFGVGSSGIILEFAEYVTVVGNTITDANTDDNAIGDSKKNAAINCYGSTNCIIRGNIVVNTLAGGGHAKYGINILNATNYPKNLYGGNIFQLMEASEYRNPYTSDPTVGHWNEGEEQTWIEANQGDAAGFRCITGGTFSSATDNTGDTTSGSPIIAGMTDTSDFNYGDYITVSAGFAGAVQRIIDISATTVTVNENSNSTESNVTVATEDPVFADLADLA